MFVSSSGPQYTGFINATPTVNSGFYLLQQRGECGEGLARCISLGMPAFSFLR